MKKNISIIVACLMIILILKQGISFFYKNSRCEVYDEFILKSFNGYVIEKYIDYQEHSYKTISVKNFDDNKIQKILFTFDTSNLFEKINVNDTIYKKINSDSFFAIKNNKKLLLSKVDFGCSR